MDKTTAAASLGALAYVQRLDIYCLLVRAGPQGVAAGEIARGLGIPNSTLSAALNVLGQGGLVRSRRESRSIIYTADFERMRDLIAFLMEDCCNGRPEVCAPIARIAGEAICCAMDQAEHESELS